jgi:hypothetical protein
VRWSVTTLGAGALAVAIPTAFFASAVHAAPILGCYCIRWHWRIPGFTAMAFLVALALVLTGMIAAAWWRHHRLARWNRRLAALGPLPWCMPGAVGPAAPLVEGALALRSSLTTRVPLDAEQLEHIEGWMDALQHSDPLATQALASAGIEPSDTVRALRIALETEGPASRTGLEVMRVVRDFFARLQAAPGPLAYRARR